MRKLTIAARERGGGGKGARVYMNDARVRLADIVKRLVRLVFGEDRLLWLFGCFAGWPGVWVDRLYFGWPMFGINLLHT